MAKFEMDGQIRAKFTEGFEKLEEGISICSKKTGEIISEAFLDENGILDKQKAAATVNETVNRVEEGVKNGAQKLSETFLNEDGTLNVDQVEASVNKTTRKVGELLSAGAGMVARFTNRFLEKRAAGESSNETADALVENRREVPKESAAPENTGETM